MLSKKFRLPSSVLFKGQVSTVREPEFIMKYKKNNLPYNRYGFVVSKAIDKRAVVRNRLKRLFRAHIENAFPPGEGFDILFVLRAAVKNLEPKEIGGKIYQAMQRI